jgi:hypothetical protein
LGAESPQYEFARLLLDAFALRGLPPVAPLFESLPFDELKKSAQAVHLAQARAKWKFERI